MLLFSRQGKLRLQKWYVAHPDKVKKKITRELITTILARKPKMCSFLEWKELKIVYKRYVIKNYEVNRMDTFLNSFPGMQVCTFAVLLNRMIMNFSLWKLFTVTLNY